jgi:2-polyprenyl-6-methoxyphenol hydroxylase-like FAD-dependent oxidoreductase
MFDVVIVGAGPVGLWLASELHLQNIPVSVIESKASKDRRSKAVALQPNSLDLFALRGLDGKVVASGDLMPVGQFGAVKPGLDYSVLRSPHPYALAIPQWRTEELLEDHARSRGIEIRRGQELVSLAQNDEGVELVLREGDRHELMRTSYVVGCDGTHSTVRAMSGIAFSGTAASFTAWLADVEFDAPPEGVVNYVADERGTMLINKIGETVYRVSGITVTSMHFPLEAEVTEEGVRHEIQSMFGSDFGMRPPLWVSRFGNATRQADTYRVGRVLVAGDAAHQHFPAGGQGVSLGLQDAMNLGWKLAATLQGWGPSGLLDSYDSERRPAGRAVLDNTVAQVALSSASTPEQLQMRKVFSECLEQPEMNKRWARRIGGFDEPIVSWGEFADHRLTGGRTSELRSSCGFTHELLLEGRFLLLDLTADGLNLDRLTDSHRDHVNHRHSTLVAGPEDW